MAEKHRYLAFEVYPDSAPDGWWDTLRATHGMWCRSLHHGEDGGKEHFHVMYCHGAATTDAALLRVVPDGIAANGVIEIVKHPRGYMRYLIHLDDPDKEQFEEGSNHIECLNGFPLDLTKEYTKEERNEQRLRCFEMIQENGIVEYADLLEGLMRLGKMDLFDYACSHTILFSHYLASRRGRAQMEDEEEEPEE